MSQFTKLKNFIDGEYVDAISQETFELVDPTTGKVNGVSPKSNAEDVDRALKSAKEAFKTWGRMTPGERQSALLKIADAIEARADELVEAQVRNSGQLKHFVRDGEIIPSADQIRFFAGAARILQGTATAEYMENHTSTIRREPHGVAAQVAPWNYPFMMAVWKMAPALAAGNTIVLKPSDTTPESTLLFAEICSEFLPKGTFNVVLGDAETGSMLVGHKIPAIVSITGSVRAGMAVAETAAKNLAIPHLELGGKAPLLVFEDANLEAAAEGIAEVGFFNAGQDCTAGTRVLAHESVYDEFLELLVKAAKNTKFGKPDDEDALYGPLNNINQIKNVEGMIERMPSYAKIETGGKRGGDEGFYFEPTVITGLKQDDEMIQNEIFAPVITVQKFSTDEEALEMSNDVNYGLSASVWTKNHSRAMRFSRDLDFGAVWINTHMPLVAEMPHGGFKHSGGGKDLSMYSLEAYTRVKHVMTNIDAE